MGIVLPFLVGAGAVALLATDTVSVPQPDNVLTDAGIVLDNGLLDTRQITQDFVGMFTPVINYDIGDTNLAAFLKLIRDGESSNNYYALVGGGNFSDVSDHPFITGEFKGIRRSDDGRLTTAAGAYQITKSTWSSLGGKKRYGDFGPKAQDNAAVDLLKRRNAYADVIAGRAGMAASSLRQEWEVFMGKRYSTAIVLDIFRQNGGNLA